MVTNQKRMTLKQSIAKMLEESLLWGPPPKHKMNRRTWGAGGGGGV